MLRRFLLASVVILFVSSSCLSASAQSAGSSTLSGTVADPTAKPIGGVTVSISGPVARTTLSAGDGSFSFDGVPPGLYRIIASKPGLTPVQDDVVAAPDAVTRSTLRLADASLSSLQTIGRVQSASGNSRNAINTTTAAVATISGQTFTDQGQLGVVRALNEIPGLTMAVGSTQEASLNWNSASPLGSGVASLRGALQFETASLIDGHPISIGLTGIFNPAFINPYVLQDVEVVKGSGIFPTNIFYAIGGTINYRTLEPTGKPGQSYDLGIDQYGNKNVNVRATGSTPDGKFGYALDYAGQGSDGPFRSDPQLLPIYGPFYTINGQPMCGNPATQCGTFEFFPPASLPGVYTPPANRPGSTYFTSPLYACCPDIPHGSNGRNELAKFRYKFSPETSLTVSYLGAQQRGASSDGQGYTLPIMFFTPPAGYTGSLPYGTVGAYDIQQNGTVTTNASLYSAEFRTALGPLSVNARYYLSNTASSIWYGNNYTSDVVLYGGVPLNNDLTPTIFNGTPARLYGTAFGPGGGTSTNDKLAGFTVQATLPVGNNVFSLSYDAYQTKSSAYVLNLPPATLLPPGSGQSFRTLTALGQFQLSPALKATLADYATLYTDHYSQDFGATFADSTHAYNAPRLGLSWRASPDVAVRASTGFSLAPPYVNLLTNSIPLLIDEADFGVTANAGDLRPETAFGFDLGADWRIARNMVLSGDIYQTTLHDQYLSSTHLAPAKYDCEAPCTPGQLGYGLYPLYITKTQNLGHSRYEGIELALRRDPVAGFGFKVQGALMRAYPYDLPAGFYDTSAGPLTTNLGVVPNVNFNASGYAYNAVSIARVPYAQGYGEINWRGRNGAYGLIGVTYYGNNNAYNQPPFGLVNASYRQPIGKHASLELATSNLTNAYSDYFGNYIGGVPTGLANGMLGSTVAHTLGPSSTSLTLHVDL